MSNKLNILQCAKLSDDLPERFHDLAIQMPLLCVCDSNTHGAFAHHFEKQFSGNKATLVNLGNDVLPTLALAESLVAAAEDCASIIAIGSGTITDLCKYAGHQAGKPLISIPTAASMNAYASKTASLLAAGGAKKSYPAKTPDIILLDEAIYANAPIRLQQAGFGDTLCRASVQLDALLSHLLCDSWYDETYFKTLSTIEAELTANASKLKQHDPAICRLLMQALILSGKAMTDANSSVPASQSEHMVAHALEQKYPTMMAPHLHGAQIAITSLTMLRLQRFILEKPLQVNILKYQKSLEEAAQATQHASVNKTAIFARTSQDDYAHVWSQLQQEKDAGSYNPDTLESAFHDAGLITTAEGLGFINEEYAKIVKTAFATRDRITFLDFAAMR